MEKTLAFVDADGQIKNLIVADDTWDYGGIDASEYHVSLGDKYNFIDRMFYKADGSVCKTKKEVESEMLAKINSINNQL